MTKLKKIVLGPISNSTKTQKFKLWQNLKSQTHCKTKLKKTQIAIKLKTKMMSKLNKLKMWQNSNYTKFNYSIPTKLTNQYFVKKIISDKTFRVFL